MTWIRFVLMYFFMVAHKAVCQTLSKAFLKSEKLVHTVGRTVGLWGSALSVTYPNSHRSDMSQACCAPCPVCHNSDMSQ